MGREIRRVPANWQHPKEKMSYGYVYIPLFDKSYEEALAAYEADPDYEWRWIGDEDMYRPHWTDEEMTHFQIYETVSEGTPTSPVFETLAQLAEWLIKEGYSTNSAYAFARDGFAPSMIGFVDNETSTFVDGITGIRMIDMEGRE